MDYAKPEDFGTDIITGFRQMAEPSGYGVKVVQLSTELQKSISYDAYMLREGYLGALFLGLTLLDPWMKEFPRSHTPAVLYDNLIRGNPTVSTLGIDNNEVIGQAVDALYGMGHRKIGYLSGALGQPHLPGALQELFQRGAPAAPAQLQLAGGVFLLLFRDAGDHLPRLLAQGVTAILCSSDLLAHTVLIRCLELGIRVPEQLSIVGFDDLPFCAHTAPPLTTIRQDRLQLGKSGYYALDSLLNGVPISSLLLHGQLILRGSTGPAPAHPCGEKRT